MSFNVIFSFFTLIAHNVLALVLAGCFLCPLDRWAGFMKAQSSPWGSEGQALGGSILKARRSEGEDGGARHPFPIQYLLS